MKVIKLSEMQARQPRRAGRIELMAGDDWYGESTKKASRGLVAMNKTNNKEKAGVAEVKEPENRSERNMRKGGQRAVWRMNSKWRSGLDQRVIESQVWPGLRRLSELSKLNEKSKKSVIGAGLTRVVKRAVVLAMAGVILMLMISGPVVAQVSPQFGFEYYGGSSKLRTLTPWGGVRFSLSTNASFIVRYNYRDMRYEYWGGDGGGGSMLKTKDASLSQFSGTIYFGEKNLTGYVSGAWLTGSESYRGYIADTGLEWKFHPSVAAIWSVYSIREKSVLWHPEEAERWINTYSMRIGVRVWLTKDLSFNPNFYLMKNSEGVDSQSFSVGLIYSPKWWVAITAYYFRYGEMAFYVFHGNYASLGLNFYF